MQQIDFFKRWENATLKFRNMFKDKTKVILVLIPTLVLATSVVLMIQANTKNKAIEEIEKTERGLVGGDKDEHGCIGSAGYTWCESKQKCLRPWEEPCDNEEIFNLLKDLEKETQIDFSGITKTEFSWFVEDFSSGNIDKGTIEGNSFSAEKITDTQVHAVHTYFEANSFELDMYNVADGTVVGAVGYQKDQLVCVVVSGISGYKNAKDDWNPAKIDTNDMEVKCGKLE